MKTISSLLFVSLALFSGATLLAQAHHDHGGASSSATADGGQLVRVTEAEAAWAKEARKTYPLTTCVTSDEALGSMGETPEYIYRVKGSPDRLVLFCCEGCEDDFKKEPAKFIAKIDAAAAKKSAK